MRKTVYHNKHYLFKTLLKNEEFLKDVQWLKDNFKHFGIGIPENGFDSYRKYLEWNKVFWDKVVEAQDTPEFKNAMNEIRDSDGMIRGDENIQKMDEIQDKYVPVIYGEYIDRILRKYELDIRDKKNKEFMILYIFLGRDDFQEDPFRVIHIRNQKTKRMELFIKIEPWTTSKDILSNWKLIEKQQKSYPEYIERNTPWREYDRDMDIYESYIKLKDSGYNFGSLEESIMHDLTKKKYSLEINQIRTIISRTKKRLGIENS